MEKGNFKHIVDVEIIQEPDAELIRFRSTRATLSAGQKPLGSRSNPICKICQNRPRHSTIDPINTLNEHPIQAIHSVNNSGFFIEVCD